MCRPNVPPDVAPRRIWLCWEVGGCDYISEEDKEGDLLLLDGVGFIRNDRMNTEMNSTCVQCRAKLTSDDNSPFRINAVAASPRRMGAFEYLIIPIVVFSFTLLRISSEKLGRGGVGALFVVSKAALPSDALHFFLGDFLTLSGHSWSRLCLLE